MEGLESSKRILTAKLADGGLLSGAVSAKATIGGTLNVGKRLTGKLKSGGHLWGVLSGKGRLRGKLSGMVRYIYVEGGVLAHAKVRSGTQDILVTPPQDAYGFGAVTVEGDEDLLPENIKAGKNILGVEGTLEAEGGPLQNITVISSAESIKIGPDTDAGFYGIGLVTVDPDPALTSEVLKVGTTAYGVTGAFGKFQSKSRTIRTNGNYPFTPDRGYDGLGEVTVTVDVPTETIENVVDANFTELYVSPGYSDQTFNKRGVTGEGEIHGYNYVKVYGDTDLVSGNIRKGATIFGVAGSYEKTEVIELDLEDNKKAYLTEFPFTVRPSSGKDAMKTATIYSDDDDFVASNIKSGVSIFGLRGTYVGEDIRTQAKLTETPTHFPWYVYPDTPDYNGLHEVKINADPNLIKNNIRRGVSIFGVEGDYESKLQKGRVVPSAKGYPAYPNEDGAMGFEYVYVEGDDFLLPENIKEGITIFKVTGTYKGDGGGGEQSIRPNLAALSKLGVYIRSSASSYTQDGYRFHINKGDITSGLWFNPLNYLEIGELYTFSYKFKKTNGELKIIGGHDLSFKECTWSIDGVEQGWSYNIGASVPNDNGEHTVVYTGVYHGNSPDGDNEIYIQPNRGDETYVAFDVWDIKMERVNRVTAWIPAEEDEQKE